MPTEPSGGWCSRRNTQKRGAFFSERRMQLSPSGRVRSRTSISIKRGKEKTVTWNQTLQGDEARGGRRIQETGRGAVRTQTRGGGLSSQNERNVLLKRWLSVIRRPAPGVRRLGHVRVVRRLVVEGDWGL